MASLEKENEESKISASSSFVLLQELQSKIKIAEDEKVIAEQDAASLRAELSKEIARFDETLKTTLKTEIEQKDLRDKEIIANKERRITFLENKIAEKDNLFNKVKSTLSDDLKKERDRCFKDTSRKNQRS